MFERFVRLAQARKALKSGHFEQAIQLSGDPLIRDHRRAEVVRRLALDGLVQRARDRADAGHFSAALGDVSRVLAVAPELDGAAELKKRLRADCADRDRRVGSARELRAEARRMAEQGDLRAAAELADSARQIHDLPADAEALDRLIDGRRQAARELCAQAEQARRDGQLTGAAELLARARGMDCEAPGADRAARALAVQVAKDLLPRLRAVHAQHGATAALALLTRERAALPELGNVSRVDAFTRELSGDKREELLGPLRDRDLDTALEIHDGLDPASRATEPVAALAPVFAELKAAVEQRDRGNFGLAEDAVRTAAKRLDIPALGRVADVLRATAERANAALVRAREHSAQGQLVEAREVLLELLEEFPMHEAARREMEIVDQGAEDKEKRLAHARNLAKECRLREATAQLVALAVPGTPGDEARLLLRDVQQRTDLVDAGLAQVLRAIHGRDSGSREGLVHCIGRLEELEKIQADHVELASLKTAAQAEIEGIDQLEVGQRALEQDQPRALIAVLTRLAELRSSLLRPDRLDSRLLALVDRAFDVAERAVQTGRLARAGEWLDAVATTAAVHDELNDRLTRCRRRLEERQSTARERVDAARAALQARDLAGAQECLEQAQLVWGDGPEVLRIERTVQAVRRREDQLSAVESLASRRDFAAAERKLSDLGPTPGLLRTRIFDLKKNIAKAQGLDDSFLLRVDEGGEFVVVRNETVTIGNLRDGRSDLTMLANLAGCHARIQRKMSFHGGMQDVVRPENGEVLVDGRRVDEARLRHGTRVRLGPSVELEYVVPSTRSLTALLVVRGGFQVAGTDKVLLMKDRGRDGRILIGSGKDAHVTVPGAEREVEIYAGQDGRIRVRCEAGGTIDGRPFQGEHPVTAGAVVACSNVTFVLQPWNKS